MIPEKTIHRTLEYLPDYAGGEFNVSPLEKGGSERKFYRISSAGGRSMILVKYSGQKEENRHYVDIAVFLAGAGVQVPHIYLHDPEEGLICMQDLGEDDLWSFRNDPWSIRQPLYESALSEVCVMHGEATRKLPEATLELQKEFNEQLYLWEQNYFFENCLTGFFGMDEAQVQRYSSLPGFQNVVKRLATLPRSLVHRDFQSQNIMIRSGSAWLIDFQGMRPGLPQYDVASLLYDPYVSLSGVERAELLDFYKRQRRASGLELADDFDEVYAMCALQRLMQVLGAYGFLGLKKGRADFLAHIPAARRSLREAASRLDGLDEFLSLLDKLP